MKRLLQFMLIVIFTALPTFAKPLDLPNDTILLCKSVALINDKGKATFIVPDDSVQTMQIKTIGDNGSVIDISGMICAYYKKQYRFSAGGLELTHATINKAHLLPDSDTYFANVWVNVKHMGIKYVCIPIN